MSAALSSIEEIVADARRGKMFILVDDESRENEGDLVIPAAKATPETINFMAKHGRGLICLALTQERVKKLKLPLMSRSNQTRHQTAFTVSIEAAKGVTTGISAQDRAVTIEAAINPQNGPEAIITPGHVFPLVAKDGGVLVRAGHTEASVDIARLAGFTPAGVICEIMRDDGSMARMPDLLEFSRKHGIRLATIADLISYRLRCDKLVERKVESVLQTRFGGEFRLTIYENKVHYAEHIALVKGDISGPEPVLVRMHAHNIMRDSLGDASENKDSDLRNSMEIISREGRGVIVIIREPSKTSLSDFIKARMENPEASPSLREYGIGAQILMDLGVRQMILLSNSKRSIVGLEGYGLEVTGQRAVSSEFQVPSSE